ncbi:GNAT family N-acetyltransferase [Promicromonospora sp. NPDC060204]|uniref:GNAT family N-acetyltransferase n=1 Tax=Promicromonospora sp. NPDC060204 TaxID=3347071 RepID=UPI003657B532
MNLRLGRVSKREHLLEVCIREMLPTEANKAAALESTIFGSDAWDVEVISACIVHPGFRFLGAALDDGKIVGHCCLAWVESGCEIVALGVLPAYRRDGIGRLMMREMVRLGRESGASRMSLNVRVDNCAAIDLYRSFGFEIAETVGDYYEDGESSYRMALSCASDIESVAVEDQVHPR